MYTGQEKYDLSMRMERTYTRETESPDHIKCAISIEHKTHIDCISPSEIVVPVKESVSLKEVATMVEEEIIGKPTEEAQEDKVKLHWNQIIASLIATLTLISCGLCIAWPTIFLHDGTSKVPLAPEHKTLVSIAVLIGACVGPILSGLLIDRIGRKWFLYATATPILAGWILIFFAKTWPLLFVGRLVAGISVGAIYTVVPIFTGEIAEPRVRGAASGIMAVMLNVGLIFTYGVGPLLSRQVLAVINLAPVVVFGLTFVWIPESPYYYLKKQKQKHSELSLTWLRGKTNNEKEIEEIKAFIESEGEGCIKEVFTVPRYRNAFLLLTLLLVDQHFAGMIAIQSYARDLLPIINIKLDIRTTLIIMGALTLVTSLVTTLTVDKIGRKIVFLVSAYGTTICLLGAGAYSYVSENGKKLNNLAWLPLVIILLHCVIFSFGLGSIPAIISSEIFPMNVKSWGIAIANIFSFIIALIVTACYQLVINAFDYYILFFALGILELIIAITASVVMPETSRKSFIEIQQILKGNGHKKENEPSTHNTDSA